MIEHAAEEERLAINDVLIRYKNLKKIYGYKIDHYWSNVAQQMLIELIWTCEAGSKNYFFKQDPEIYFKKCRTCLLQNITQARLSRTVW